MDEGNTDLQGQKAIISSVAGFLSSTDIWVIFQF